MAIYYRLLDYPKGDWVARTESEALALQIEQMDLFTSVPPHMMRPDMRPLQREALKVNVPLKLLEEVGMEGLPRELQHLKLHLAKSRAETRFAQRDGKEADERRILSSHERIDEMLIANGERPVPKYDIFKNAIAAQAGRATGKQREELHLFFKDLGQRRPDLLSQIGVIMAEES